MILPPNLEISRMNTTKDHIASWAGHQSKCLKKKKRIF